MGAAQPLATEQPGAGAQPSAAALPQACESATRSRPMATIPPPDMGALYRAHARSVYAFIYSKVGNRETAEDLTADVFLKALAHLDLTREEHSIVAWLFRVARNAVNDYWRSGQGAPVIPFEEALLGRDQRTTVATQGRHAALQAQALLEQLPATYRTVLSHRLLEGASVGETAQAMGISVSYVKVLQHRALKRAAELHTRATHATTAS